MDTLPSTPPSVFFWRETELPYGFLSQWFSSPFAEEGVSYPTAEHYMMYHKARLYSDQDRASKILTIRSPAEAKYLAREVDMSKDRGKLWEREKYRIVERGTYLKFPQNAALKDRLLGTGEAELVEASSSDRVWGVGFPAEFAEANRASWGMNLLGQALMSTRERFREDDEG